MKLFFLIFYFLLFTNCSFDNKTGIWENENNTIPNKDKKNKIFDGFKKISVVEKPFQENISAKDQSILDIPNPEINTSWQDIFYTSNNNFKNFKFNNLNEIIFKSKKLSKYLVDTYKLFEDGNLIINDVKGNLVIFSVNENRKISEIVIIGNNLFVVDYLGIIFAVNIDTGEFSAIQSANEGDNIVNGINISKLFNFEDNLFILLNNTTLLKVTINE